MLTLCHFETAVCAAKVRVTLAEKGIPWEDKRIDLSRGEQFDPEYLELNPNGVVPTLLHDGQPIVESSLILYYIDEVFPEPPLMPKEPRLRHRVRMYNKLIDEYVHTVDRQVVGLNDDL